jgi:hypothetical protein
MDMRNILKKSQTAELKQDPLYPVIVRIQNVHATFSIQDQRPRIEKLAFIATLSTPAPNEPAVEREFRDAMIAILAQVHVSLAVQHDRIRVIQLARLVAALAPMLN